MKIKQFLGALAGDAIIFAAVLVGTPFLTRIANLSFIAMLGFRRPQRLCLRGTILPARSYAGKYTDPSAPEGTESFRASGMSCPWFGWGVFTNHDMRANGNTFSSAC